METMKTTLQEQTINKIVENINTISKLNEEKDKLEQENYNLISNILEDCENKEKKLLNYEEWQKQATILLENLKENK